MEFVSGKEGPIIPDPDKEADAEHLAMTQAAMDFFAASADRLAQFKQRVEETGRSGRDTVIVLANVDDANGAVLAEILMPGHNWQQYRDAGQIPVARGIAAKEGVPEFLEEIGYASAASELRDTDDLRVIVLSAGVALVMNVAFESE